MVAIFFFNLRLYAPSPLPSDNAHIPKTLIRQLNASRAVLETDTPKQMQHLFPEGYYFCYVLHGLTWVEAAIREPTHAPEAIQQAKFAFKHLESADGKAPFDPKLPPDHGMFYSAWKAHLLAGIVLIQNGESEEELNQLQRDCDSLATAFKQAQTPFLASYPDAVWPCDSIPAIHAMKTYDSITGAALPIRYRQMACRHP